MSPSYLTGLVSGNPDLRMTRLFSGSI